MNDMCLADDNGHYRNAGQQQREKLPEIEANYDSDSSTEEV